ncbi:MAG: DUF1800 family protein [Flavobacteriales bacterium]|nr:DUF1800 family protein [Flavobacteriales bacterium]
MPGEFPAVGPRISTDGAMLVYLNGYLKHQAAPDENYGRELMELFTSGKEAVRPKRTCRPPRACSQADGARNRCLGRSRPPFRDLPAQAAATDDKQFSASSTTRDPGADGIEAAVKPN